MKWDSKQQNHTPVTTHVGTTILTNLCCCCFQKDLLEQALQDINQPRLEVSAPWIYCVSLY